MNLKLTLSEDGKKDDVFITFHGSDSAKSIGEKLAFAAKACGTELAKAAGLNEFHAEYMEAQIRDSFNESMGTPEDGAVRRVD